EEGGIRKLAGFPGNVTDTAAYGVSGDGKRVVGSAFAGSNVQMGFLWEDGKSVQLFTDLLPVANPNHTLALYTANSDGTVIGGQIGYDVDGTGDVLFEAFVARQVDVGAWDMNLLVAPSDQDPTGAAMAMNSDGTIVVGYTGYKGAFSWSPKGGMLSISPMRELTTYALSEDGSLVAGGGADPGLAFLWDPT
ncbi:MAG: hypothetical protein WC889_08230, partial [Myxococcota bacterium]